MIFIMKTYKLNFKFRLTKTSIAEAQSISTQIAAINVRRNRDEKDGVVPPRTGRIRDRGDGAKEAAHPGDLPWQ